MNTIYTNIKNKIKDGRKQLAVLIDPDKLSEAVLYHTISLCNEAHVDFLFVGGSHVLDGRKQSCIREAHRQLSCPLVLFPGTTLQLDTPADAVLLLSLISGRNAELLIGKHVEAAPHLRDRGIEIIPTGYMLVDGNTPTAVGYMSQTQPIPRNQVNIAAATAMAGEMLGLKTIYLEAGSGARSPVPTDMVAGVRASVDIPVLVGGGIRTAEKAGQLAGAGADIIVVGNAIEENPDIIMDLSAAVHEQNITSL